MGDGGCPSAPTGEGPSPSQQPLGFSRAIPEDRLWEQKGFLSAIANVLVSQGSRPEISPLPAFAGSSSGRWTSSAFLLQDETPGREPIPGPLGWWEGAGRALLGDAGAAPSVSCRCPLVETGEISEKIRWGRAGCGGWKPTRGSGLGLLGSPPGTEAWPAAPVPFASLVLLEGEGNGINLAWEAGHAGIQILPLGTVFWSLNPCVATAVRALSG